MNTLRLSPELDPPAAELAAIIDAHAGDYPLVSFHQNSSDPDVTWMYAHLVVEVVVRDGHTSIHSREQGSVMVEAGSLWQGMELLRRTEKLRQNRDWPYVRLN